MPGHICQNPQVKQDIAHHPKPAWEGIYIKTVAFISLGREEGNFLEHTWCLHAINRNFLREENNLGIDNKGKVYTSLDLASELRELRIFSPSDMVFYLFNTEQVYDTRKCKKENESIHFYHQK